MECCPGAIVGERTNHNRIVYRFCGKATSPNRSHLFAERKFQIMRTSQPMLALLITMLFNSSSSGDCPAAFRRSHLILGRTQLTPASAGSIGNGSNALSALNSNVNRGPSDFDRRNAFSMALTYDVPSPKWNTFANATVARLVHGECCASSIRSSG